MVSKRDDDVGKFTDNEGLVRNIWTESWISSAVATVALVLPARTAPKIVGFYPTRN
jgi:hypothetical protein